MKTGGLRQALGAASLALSVLSQPAQAAPGDKARVSNLSDVTFGTITNLITDQRSAQDVCVYSNSASGGYTVTATGSGAGAALSLSSGAAELPYEVEWAAQPSRTVGTTLTAGSVTSGFVSSANNQNCSPGSGPTASLIVVLRASALGSATTGSYTGTLTLVIEPL